jgi:formylglycine-generating enzyme required for sulfatase activity
MDMKEQISELIRDRITWVTTFSLAILTALLTRENENPALLSLGLYLFLLIFISLNSAYILVAQKKRPGIFVESKEVQTEISVPKYPALHLFAKGGLAVSSIMLISMFFIPGFQGVFSPTGTATPAATLITINTQTPNVAIISPTLTKTIPSLTATNPLPGITPTGSTPSPNVSNTPVESPDYIDAFGVPMKLVPAGSFMMGNDADTALAECEQFGIDCDREWFIREEPVHEVDLDAYYIDKYEVTNKFYEACVNAEVCSPPIQSRSFARDDYFGNSEFDDYPVVFVNWDMAEAYCEWRGAKLPTEAQWEKAARGTDERIFPWGNDLDYKYANFDQIIRDTTMVSQYEKGKSPYGVYDLAGNTVEWVYDWYSETYYQISPSSNPIGPDQGDGRVVRGGSWFDKDQIRSAWRDGWEPFTNRDGIGFRCAMNVNP